MSAQSAKSKKTKVTMMHVHVWRGYVDAVVELPSGKTHRVMHHPKFAWSCNCNGGKRCAQVKRIKELVPAELFEKADKGELKYVD